MGTPPGPTPDELDNISRIVNWVYAQLNVIATGGIAIIGGVLWRASAKIAKFEAEQIKQNEDIAELKEMRKAQTLKIETLATKDDLEQAVSNITGELRAGMSTMAQVVTRSQR